jgi:TonB family protein
LIGVQMEDLRCVPQLHSASERVINQPVLALPTSFTPPSGRWWRLRRKSLLRRRSHFLVEDLPCPFDVDHQEVTTCQPDTESHLDQGPADGWDYSFSDPASVSVSGDTVFDDPTTISQVDAKQGLLSRLDLAPENSEFVAALFSSLSQPTVSDTTLRFFALSLAAHLAAFSLFAATPASTVPGFGGISERPISVRLKEACEINTPADPSPGSVDSLASMPSVARRDPKTEETKTPEKTEKELPTEVEHKDMIRKTPTEYRTVDGKHPIESFRVHSRQTPERSPHGPPNDSTCAQDSIASTPSVASPERQGPPKLGDEAQTYKDLILSAIHDAAYYPKAALRNMAHGRTVVSFTINKDGSLGAIMVMSHGDSKVLDEAALKIVEKASAHFPPFPDKLMKDQVSYIVPIIFKK